jgi:HD-like signal output (HDOD) protein
MIAWRRARKVREENQSHLGIQGWVDRIRERDMPVFGRTVHEVKAVTSDEFASASKLASVILQDPALTTKVLKLANSVLFNPARQSISTVSRAIVVLGFDLVGQLVLSISLIDSLLSGGPRERVVTEMARCFHAAVQARTAAMCKSSKAAEEVFIAALLGRVGEMAFWCFGGRSAEQLDSAMKDQPEERPEDLQMDLLGFRLRNLSSALAREWRLGALVASASENPASPTPDQASIALGYRFAHAVEEGWDSPAAKKVLQELTEFCEKPLDELQHEIINNAAEAARVAAQFGATEAAARIPVPPNGLVIDIAAEAAQDTDPAPDPLLQLKILRDLAMLLSNRPSLNEVLQLVLEGIYRGLGMSRAVFALLTPDRQKMVGKVALGREAEQFAQRFVFPLDGRPGEVINWVYANSRPVWLKEPLPQGVRIDRLEHVAGRHDGFLAPIVATGRVIGLFYADRSNGMPLDDETWQGFQHFVQQASLSFEHVAGRNTPVKK